MTHFEKQLKVYEAIGDVENAADTRYNIAHAKSECAGGNSEEGRLKTSQELYEIRVAKYGEEYELTICAGGMYAIELVKAFHGDEARENLTRLLATSKQVLGRHHKITQMFELTLQCAKMKELLLKWVNGIYSSKSVFVVCILSGVLAMSYQLVKLSLSLWTVGTINYIMFIV